MISFSDLMTVAGAVAVIAAAATVAGIAAARLLAARSLATLMSVVAAVTMVAALAGVAVITIEMLINAHDRDVVLTVVVVAGLAGATVALLVGHRMSRASRVLVSAVRRAGASGRYQPPAAALPAEFAAVSAEFAAAQERLAQARAREQALESSRRELVAWVSHDLRAPVAGLRAMAEALEDGVVTDPKTVSTYHGQIRREAGRLSTMIDDLFELSRIHAGALRLDRCAVSLDDLVAEALASAQPLARAKGVRLHGSAAGGPPVRVDASEFGRALHNLVINAIRHTPSGGPVEVRSDVEQGVARVSVSDSCGGIPADALPRLFDVGFRGETARTPGPGKGAGLGLSIARGIVQAHAGEIAVRNVGTGCEFVIRLPPEPAPARVAA
jgi:signal transduction histidine kinase